jgi:protocatechuate 3,4-dioxygenase beta subunit
MMAAVIMGNLMKYIALAFSLLFPVTVLAQAQDPVVATHCEITPSSLPTVIMPVPMNLTNNLRRGEGSPEVASGTPIYIQGTVRDEMCVPIPGVKVELWHADTKGRYLGDKDVDPYFVGSGTAVTDNMGQYTFLSVLPDTPKGGALPLAHIRVSHPDFSILETDMYFSEIDAATRLSMHLSDDTARLLTATSSPIDFSKPDAGNVYEFHITLDGVSPMRTF